VDMMKAFTVTQGGADTAAETTIPTLIQPGITFGAWLLKAVEVTISPNLLKAWAAADMDWTLQLTKRSLASSITRLVTYADTDLIASINLASIMTGTAATAQLVDATRVYTMPPGVIVYSENLYVQQISTGTGATNIAWGRILYEVINLTASQAMAVIASRP
jgi:hypothetical protein